MKYLQQAKAFIFDMDGVLCDSELLVAEAAISMFKQRYDIQVSESDFRPFIGTGEERYLCGVAESLGVALAIPEDKEEVYRLYAERVKGRLQAIPGVISFIMRAVECRISLAVATSADRFKMEVNLRELGLSYKFFSGLVSGSEIERKKPAPDIFLTTARKMDVKPETCVVFEDAVNGVKAAKAAGAMCVGIASSFSHATLLSAGADVVVPDFTKLINFIRPDRSTL